MVQGPIHFDGGNRDLVLRDFPDLAGVRVGLPGGISDYSTVLKDVLEEPIPQLV